MKILVSRIKNWSDKQRIEEIRKLVSEVQEDETLPQWASDSLDEVLQILKYWKEHLKKEVVKPKKKIKKPMNLFN